jgi:hypothetical protein
MTAIRSLNTKLSDIYHKLENGALHISALPPNVTGRQKKGPSRAHGLATLLQVNYLYVLPGKTSPDTQSAILRIRQRNARAFYKDVYFFEGLRYGVTTHMR